MTNRNPIVFLAIGLVMCVLACAKFVGPATAKGDGYYFKCGDEDCIVGFHECSKTKPLTCRRAADFWHGSGHDAGADVDASDAASE